MESERQTHLAEGREALGSGGVTGSQALYLV